MGIGFVVAIYTSVSNSGGRFVLVGALPLVQKVFDFTRMSTVIPIAPDFSSGLRAIEESVLNRLRDAQPAMFGPSEWEQMDRTRQVEVMGDLIERVGYDGAARQISIRFRAVGEKVSA